MFSDYECWKWVCSYNMGVAVVFGLQMYKAGSLSQFLCFCVWVHIPSSHLSDIFEWGIRCMLLWCHKKNKRDYGLGYEIEFSENRSFHFFKKRFLVPMTIKYIFETLCILKSPKDGWGSEGDQFASPLINKNKKQYERYRKRRYSNLHHFIWNAESSFSGFRSWIAWTQCLENIM